MKDEKIFKCPFCKCIFLNREDLSNHLKAMTVKPPPANAPLINPSDHQYMMNKGHNELERSLYEFTGDI